MKLKKYEGLFLVTGSEAQKNPDAVEEHIKGLIEKCSCSLLMMDRWPEQRLAYNIKGRSKGTYFLTYFNAPPEAIDTLRRECQLSETVTRNLIIRYEKDEIPKPPEKPAADEKPEPETKEDTTASSTEDKDAVSAETPVEAPADAEAPQAPHPVPSRGISAGLMTNTNEDADTNGTEPVDNDDSGGAEEPADGKAPEE
jgi:small subunit ribosomal protein S6